MGRYGVDILCLQDTRVGVGDLPRYKERVVISLGPQAKCFIDGGDSLQGPVRVGGQMILVGQLWGAKCHHHKADESKLGVVAWIDIKLAQPDAHLRIITTYWPVKAAETDTPGRMWNRVSSYLHNTLKSEVSPLEHIQDVIMGRVDNSMGKGGQAVILVGDLNASWDDAQASHRVKEWAGENQWSNPMTALARQHLDSGGTQGRPGGGLATYWRNPRQPTSWIDHIFLQEASVITCSGGAIAYGLGWLEVSDHRPLIASFTGAELFRHTHPRHGPTKTPVSLCRAELSGTQVDKEKFQANLTGGIVRQLAMEGPITDPILAGDCLQRIADASVHSVPRPPRAPLQRCGIKDGWSPQLIARKAQLICLHKIWRHLKGLHKQHRWRGAVEMETGVHELTWDWQNRVRALKWDDDTMDPMVWEIGTSPWEWRTLQESRAKLVARCQHEIALVRKSLHGRARTEFCKKISYYTRLREHLRATGKLGKVISSILENHPERFILEALAMDDITEDNGVVRPINSRELHAAVQKYFEDLYRLPGLQEGRQADITHGGLLWEQAGDWEVFRDTYRDLDLPGFPLRRFWEALVDKPGREAVEQDLQQTLANPPSYVSFCQAIQAKKGHTMGGFSGLTYNMMKA